MLFVFLSSWVVCILCVPGFSAAFPARDEILQQWKSNFQLPCEVLFHGWLQSHCIQPCIRGLQYLQEALSNGLCHCPLLNCYQVALSSLALFSFSSSLQSRHNFRDLKEFKIDENFFGLGWQGRSVYPSLTISCTCVAGLGRKWKNSEADALQQQTACFSYIFWVQGCY